MKLEPRMVPQPLWGITLRADLGERWLPEVSRPVRDHAQTCAMCGGRGDCRRSNWRLCCDEVWSYSDADPVVSAVIAKLGTDPAKLRAVEDLIPGLAYQLLDSPPIAKLVDLQALCWTCNAMIHFGHTETTVGWPTCEGVVRHAARINGVDPDAMMERVFYEQAAWLIRSAVPDWSITWVGWEAIRDHRAALKVDGAIR